jgi:hypothetical protein
MMNDRPVRTVSRVPHDELEPNRRPANRRDFLDSPPRYLRQVTG